MTFAPLLLLIGLAHYAPALLSSIVGGSVSAWDYCMQGVQAAALWCVVARLAADPAAKAACVLAVFESAQRPVCRAMLPMDRAPGLSGDQSLCEAAIGISTSWVGIVAALFVVCVAQEVERGRQGH